LSYLLIILLLASSTTLCQSTLSGHVTDAATGEPVDFATVYFDGTTVGQITDEEGHFNLSLEEIELPALLVVSHLSYQTYSQRVTEAADTLAIGLKLRARQLVGATVSERNQRESNLEEFRRLLLGGDEWGRNARILNEDVLFFERAYAPTSLSVPNAEMRQVILMRDHPGGRWNRDSSEFTFDQTTAFAAQASAPLLIELPDLGYRLQLDLTTFRTDYRSGSTGYFGYYYFRPLDGKGKKQWGKNRLRAYSGSTQEFLRHLGEGSLDSMGYVTYLRERDGLQRTVTPIDLAPNVKQSEGNRVEVIRLKDHDIAILHYTDSRGNPVPARRRKRYQPRQSSVLVTDHRCSFYSDGTIGEDCLLFGGEMGQRGLAWSLPADWAAPGD
jgi:hypothetical protein